MFAALSLIGFALASASSVLAIVAIVYARAVGGFAFYDPSLVRIYQSGTGLSLMGLLSAVIGVWRPSSLRWHALTSALGTLLFWLMAAASE